MTKCIIYFEINSEFNINTGKKKRDIITGEQFTDFVR